MAEKSENKDRNGNSKNSFHIRHYLTPQEIQVVGFILVSILIGTTVIFIHLRYSGFAKDVIIDTATDTLHSATAEQATGDNSPTVPQRAKPTHPTHPKEQPLLPKSININTASAGELSMLPKIGPKTAEAIIAYRTKHGPFRKPEHLTRVKGIGDKTYEKLKEYITVQ